MLSLSVSSFRAKLYLAFTVIASLTLFGTVFALYLFSKYGNVVSTTADEAIPRMLTAMQLSERSALLAAMAPVLAASKGEEQLRAVEIRLDFLANQIDKRADQLDAHAFGSNHRAIQKASAEIVTTLAILKDLTLARLSRERRKLKILAETRRIQAELLDIVDPIIYGATSLTNLFAKRSGRRDANAVKKLARVDANVLLALLEIRVAAEQIVADLDRDLDERKHCDHASTQIRIHLRLLETLTDGSTLQQWRNAAAKLADAGICKAPPPSRDTREGAEQVAYLHAQIEALESHIAVRKEGFLTAHEKTALQVQATPVKLIDDAIREFRYALDIKAEVNLLIALLTAASNADNKFTVANLYNGFRRSFDAFRNAVNVFKNSALAERNPFLAESLFAIEDKLVILGEGDHNLFKLRLLEFRSAEQLSGLLANHRKQAARLTAHATALVNAVRGEIASLREEMAYWRVTGASVLVAICLGSVLIAGLIVLFTARRLSRHESDLRDAKTTAEMANRELEAFNYSVSHDLLAPLRTLDGFSQALLEDYGDKLDDIGRRYLGFLRDGSQDMRKLIDGLLALSRSSRGELMRERVNLSELAKEIMAAHQEADPERKVCALVAPMIEAEGDPSLLKTLLENLLGNAWKYSSKTPDARIEFGSEENAEGTFYYVRDNGIGFDMAYQDRLFVPFRRLHKPGEFEGSGIGLATVQRIIHRHGGHIWAEAAAGKGATFHFTLGN